MQHAAAAVVVVVEILAVWSSHRSFTGGELVGGQRQKLVIC